tara:strand:+ start:976 stop:1878 length:903 start_codon:yes stop_codon:yes gene_type:complete
MKSLKDLTVVIVTYNTTKKVILDCLNSISKDVSILIVENSNSFINENLIITKFPNVNIVCTGENLGYGKGNNFGINRVKTDYVLILNPDVTCDIKFFSNIFSVIDEAKDFTIIGCQYLSDNVFMPAGFFEKKNNDNFVKDFKSSNIKSITEVEWVTGCSMLLNLKKFNNREIFDKNFFLYFEEFDLCKFIKKTGGKIYTSNKLKVHHLGFKSSLNEDEIENLKTMNIKDWHFMWSSFYFYKKNYNFFYALFKLSGKLIKSFVKMIYFSVTFQKNNKNKYLYRFLGLFNSMIGNPSNYRGN